MHSFTRRARRRFARVWGPRRRRRFPGSSAFRLEESFHDAESLALRGARSGSAFSRRIHRHCRRANEVGHAHGVSTQQLSHRKYRSVRRRCRSGDWRETEAHRSQQRIAVQGERDQARRAKRTGADRRNLDLRVCERGSAVRSRFGSVSGDELPRRRKTVEGVAQGARGPFRQAGAESPLRRTVAAARHLQPSGAAPPTAPE